MPHSQNVEAPIAELTYQARPDVVASDIGGHWALLDLETSLYYTLNATGAEVWNAMQSPASFEKLLKAVTSSFSVSEEMCRADIETLVQDLVAAGLVTTTSSPGHA